MKRSVSNSRLLIASAAALLLLPVALRLGYNQRFRLAEALEVHAAPIPSTAFTLHLTEVVRKGPQREGPGKITQQLIVAQRADGARSETTINHPGTSSEHRTRLIRMADFTHVQAWDSVGLKTTGKPWPKELMIRHATSRSSPASECAMKVDGRPAHPSDYRIVRKAMIRGIQAVQFMRSDASMEIWNAPQLDCEVVYRMAVFSDPSGSVTDTSEKFATAYQLDDPDPGLFDVSNLQEASSVHAIEATYRKAGYPESFIQKAISEMRSGGRR